VGRTLSRRRREEAHDMTRANPILDVGDAAPDFALPNPRTGEIVRLSDLLGAPLLLYFGRGTWCPTCRNWMDTIRKNLTKLEERNCATVTIMAQSPSRMKAALEERDYPFPVLADADRTVVRAYGVYVRANFESINIARPANFVLDQKGTIRYMHIASIQTEYASFDEILATLDSLPD
jgi:peroxiredoxin